MGAESRRGESASLAEEVTRFRLRSPELGERRIGSGLWVGVRNGPRTELRTANVLVAGDQHDSLAEDPE